MNAVASPSSDNQFVIAKFGGTSVADYHAMNKSADVVLANENVRIVVLSASAGITNLLVALAEGCEIDKRDELLQQVRDIQYSIVDHLDNANIIREEIDRLLDNIARLADAASLATSAALTDELVSHGELMSTLLFVELLRQRNANSEWLDIRRVMKTNDQFGRAEPDLIQLSALAKEHIQPKLANAIVITQGFIGQDNKGRTTTLGRGAVIIPQHCSVNHLISIVLISGLMYPAFIRLILA